MKTKRTYINRIEIEALKHAIDIIELEGKVEDADVAKALKNIVIKATE